MATTVRHVRWLCLFRVQNAIRFDNLVSDLAAGTFEVIVKAWEVRTLQVWNRGAFRQPWGNCFIRIASKTEFGAAAAAFHYIQVQGGDPFGAVTQFGPASTYGVWHVDAEPTVAAHEVGHLMGLDDEYHYNANGQYVNDNLQTTGPQSIMAETSGTVAALPEHYGKILAQFHAQCPHECGRQSMRARMMRFLSRLWQFKIEDGIPVERIGGPPVPDPPPVPPPNPWEGQAIERIFQKIESGRPHDMMLGVDALVAMGPPAAADLARNLGHQHPLRRWGCATALGRIGDTSVAPALRERLGDPNIGARLASAVSLLQLHDTAGVPVLIAALASDEVMIGHPPRLARAYAHIALRHWTREDFGFDPEAPARERLRAAAQWQAWWDADGADFHLP